MSIQERLTELAPRLIAYSKFVRSPELDNDDIQQEMSLALLERAAVDPAFSEQSTSYMAWYATWSAKNAAAKTRTYDGHVQEAGDEMLEVVLIGHDEATSDPEAIAEQNEELDELLAQISAMTPENQTVVKMTYLGYSNNEIAARLNITPAAVSWRKKNVIRPRLQPKHRE
jgi:RNA polymerase sigma factor (sigma-70 family)